MELQAWACKTSTVFPPNLGLDPRVSHRAPPQTPSILPSPPPVPLFPSWIKSLLLLARTSSRILKEQDTFLMTVEGLFSNRFSFPLTLEFLSYLNGPSFSGGLALSPPCFYCVSARSCVSPFFSHCTVYRRRSPHEWNSCDVLLVLVATTPTSMPPLEGLLPAPSFSARLRQGNRVQTVPPAHHLSRRMPDRG